MSDRTVVPLEGEYEQDQGVAATPPGLRPFGAEPASQSQAEPLVPNAGEWLVIRDWNLSVREIAKVSPKLFKLGAGTSRYPTQIGRDDKRIAAHAPDRAKAEWLRDGIAGIDGEFNRRRRAADADRDERVKAARAAQEKAIARLLASGIVAATAGETREAGLDERSEQSPVPEGQTPNLNQGHHP